MRDDNPDFGTADSLITIDIDAITGNWRMILAAVTLLPFLLFFTKLNWSRPLGWLAGCFNRLIELIDRAIER